MANQPRSLTMTPGWLKGISNHAKLIARLMGDRRVNPVLKLLPIGALVYLVVPTDVMPLLPFDDAAVIWAGTALFVELCPADVVAECRKAITAEAGTHPAEQPEDTIDAEYRDL